jgi:hypothetical protein
MEDKSWIKLYRKILKSPIWDNEKALKIWIWCLVKATHEDRMQLVGQQEVFLEKGQFVFGRKKASEELKMSESMIYRYMKVLEKLQMLYIKPNNKFSVVGIEKWEDYQFNEKDLNNNLNNKRTTNEHKQECKEIYINLYNKYKAEIEKASAKEKLHIISKCKQCEEYLKLSVEEQEDLFYDLMKIDKRYK